MHCKWQRLALLGIVAWVAAECSALNPMISMARADDAATWVDGRLEELVALYREFHQHPELSLEEAETSKRVAREIRAAGYDTSEGVGGYGVVGLLENGDGPLVMLRSDMDALPVAENTELSYASQVEVETAAGGKTGVMHACGHDIHMTNLIGVARYFAEHRKIWRGTLMMVFQPAEERGLGAAAMLEDKLFSRFGTPDVAVALHVDSSLATGKVGYRAGYTMANVDSVDIAIKGRGGHGAYPQATVDPIVIAARLVLDLQTITSREISPMDPAVVTVGSIHGGTKHNVISDGCHLQLTIRSYTDEVRENLIEAIRRKSMAAAASAKAPDPEVTVSEGTPALYNDDDLVAQLLPALQAEIGDANVIASEAVMGGEDFSRFGRAGVPVFMYRLGSVRDERLRGYARFDRPPPSLHSAIYYPDAEETLRTGIRTMTAAVVRLMSSSDATE